MQGNPQQIEEDEMLWNWAKAEAVSLRHGHFYDRNGADFKKSLINSTPYRDITPKHLDIAAKIVKGSRIYFLSDLLVNGKSTWHKATMELADLPNLKLPQYPPFVDLSPNRTLGEFVRKLDNGKTLKGSDGSIDTGFMVNYNRIKSNFDSSLMQGLPILVCPNIKGPFQLIEGYNRLSVITSIYLKSGEIESLKNVDVIIGVCLTLNQISLYKD